METHTTSFRALRLPQVIDKTSVSRSQIFRMMKAGTFPTSYQLSETGCVVAWNEAEIDAWLEDKFMEPSLSGAPAVIKRGVENG